MGRTIRFGGPQLGEGARTWFESRVSIEQENGQEVTVGGDPVIAYHGDEFDSDEMGKRLDPDLGEESWAEYHVRTGRAAWMDEAPTETTEPEPEALQ